METENKDQIIENLKERVACLETQLKRCSVSAKVIGRTCPSCGSAKVESRKQKEFIQAPYGPKVSYEIDVDTCLVCEEEGEFTQGYFRSSNDIKIDLALDESKNKSVDFMLEELENQGISQSYLNRSLRLSSAEDYYDEAAIVLLRFVYTYPWLLEVSDSNFEKVNVDLLRKEWRATKEWRNSHG